MIDEEIRQAIRQEVRAYMEDYGAALEDNGMDGEVPAVDADEIDENNSSVPITIMSNGVPTAYKQVVLGQLMERIGDDVADRGFLRDSDLDSSVFTGSSSGITFSEEALRHVMKSSASSDDWEHAGDGAVPTVGCVYANTLDSITEAELNSIFN